MTEYRLTVDPPSGGPSAAIRYLNGSMFKLAIADWHRHEFDRLDAGLTPEHFSRFPRLSLDALGHGDGVFLQLSGAFDGFACAVAHRHGLNNPENASFGGWNDSLARACDGALGERIRAVAADAEFKSLIAYRNLAAHRGVVGESITTGQRNDNPGHTIWFALSDSLPPGILDKPRSPLVPILERDTNWARLALRGLHDIAVDAWKLADDPNLIADFWNLGATSEDET